MTFAVRTAAEPLGFVPAIRQAIQSVDGNLVMTDIKTQERQREQSAANERLLAKCTTTLGLLALLLACMGLYGVMSYNVSRRTNEIGIRIALGATGGRVLGELMQSTMVTVAIGAVLGIAGSIAAARLLSATLFGIYTGGSSLLFGVKARDPLTLAASTLCLLAVSAAAGYLPARRASRVDPLTALRYE